MGLEAGAFTEKDLFSPAFTEIPYAGVQPEFTRYHTQFDGYTDAHGIQQIEDAILTSSEGFVYASGIDAFGYVPTPHKKYDHPPTGDFVRDRAVSRGKRKYDGEPRQAANYPGPDATIVIDYRQDTGIVIWDVAAPIVIHGKQHWGAFRVGVQRDQLDIRTNDVVIGLGRILALAVLVLGIAIFLATRRSMRPLGELASAATLLSTTFDGTELEKPIRATSRDEVGQMAKALERLRISLRKAFRADGSLASSPATYPEETTQRGSSS